MSAIPPISPKKVWSSVAPYAAPPVAAAVAIIPFFHGLVIKSAQQIGKAIPSTTILNAIKSGVRAAPTIGAVIGTQMLSQGVVEKAIQKRSKDEESVSSMIMSSIIVGGISTPLLAVFNGQTMGFSISESLRKLSFKQAGAIITRETTFLFSLRVSGPMSKMMQSVFGDNKAVKYSSHFATGAIGSIVGHIPDTVLTLLQKNMRVTNPYHLMRGAPVRAVALGGFTLCYNIAKEILNPKTNEQHSKS